MNMQQGGVANGSLARRAYRREFITPMVDRARQRVAELMTRRRPLMYRVFTTLSWCRLGQSLAIVAASLSFQCWAGEKGLLIDPAKFLDPRLPLSNFPAFNGSRAHGMIRFKGESFGASGFLVGPGHCNFRTALHVAQSRLKVLVEANGKARLDTSSIDKIEFEIFVDPNYSTVTWQNPYEHMQDYFNHKAAGKVISHGEGSLILLRNDRYEVLNDEDWMVQTITPCAQVDPVPALRITEHDLSSGKTYPVKALGFPQDKILSDRLIRPYIVQCRGSLTPGIRKGMKTDCTANYGQSGGAVIIIARSPTTDKLDSYYLSNITSQYFQVTPYGLQNLSVGETFSLSSVPISIDE